VRAVDAVEVELGLPPDDLLEPVVEDDIDDEEDV